MSANADETNDLEIQATHDDATEPVENAENNMESSDKSDSAPLPNVNTSEMEDERVNDENTEPETEDASEEIEKSDNLRSLRLPLSKIKSIMKLDPDVSICSADAAFLICRATVSNCNSQHRATH